MAKNIEWYYVDASRSQQGPKTIKELRALWTSQTIKGDTLVWCEGQPGWSAIDTLKDLKEQISMKEKKALPPPLPPTIPPAIAPQTPAIGPSPDISPNARAIGRAMMATVIPAKTSPLIFVWSDLKFLEGFISFRLFIINEII